MQLYPLVKSRDSCQAEQGIEPGFDDPAATAPNEPPEDDEDGEEGEAAGKQAYVQKKR